MIFCTKHQHNTDLNSTSGALTHRYYVRDYLGSTRAVVDEDGNVLQSTAYDPSGVPLTPNSLLKLSNSTQAKISSTCKEQAGMTIKLDIMTA